MTETLAHVHIIDDPGLYSVRSTSPTVYFVDSPDPDAPRYLRVRGRGLSMGSHRDQAWHELWALRIATGPDGSAIALGPRSALQVGYDHYFEARRFSHPRGDLYWIVSRDCTQIERLKDMPSPDEMTKSDDWLTP